MLRRLTAILLLLLLAVPAWAIEKTPHLSRSTAYTWTALQTFNAGLLLPASAYVSLGGTYGSSGYGLRDNAGTMEYKNSGGAWAAIGGGGGAPTTATYVTVTAEGGLSAEVNLGALTTGLLKHTVSGGTSTPATAIAGTDYVSPSSTETLTNKTLDGEGTGNAITLVYEWDLDLVGCVGGTAGHIWNTGIITAPTATCATGTNRVTGWGAWPDSDGAVGVFVTKHLPTGWTGSLDADIWWNTTGTGNARFQIATICYADDEADDAAFNTASVVTAAAGTSGRPNKQAITGITTTGCAAGEMMRIKFFRDRTEASDTLNAALNVEKIIFTLRVTR